MRLRLQFHEDELEYAWFQPVRDFHGLVIFKGKKWEFFAHLDDPDKKCDVLCVFAELPTYDPNWHATTYYNLDDELHSRIECECGKEKHGFANHTFWCKKWRKM